MKKPLFESRFVGHIQVRTADIDTSLDWYQRVLQLRHSGTAGLLEDAINVITRDALCFMSCGEHHHDFGLFQGHRKDWSVAAVTPDDFHHLSFTLRDDTSLDSFKQHLATEGIEFTPGPALPDPTATYTEHNCLCLRDPDGHFVEVHSAEVDADAR